MFWRCPQRIRKKGLLWVYVPALLVCGAPYLSAQEQRDSFFQKDYAKGVAVTGTAQARDTSATAIGKTNSATPVPEIDLSRFPPEMHDFIRRRFEGALGQKGIFPPPTIMLVVNSTDAAHLNQVVQKALSLDLKGIALIGQIIHLGDYRTLATDLEIKLKSRGIQYAAGAEPPFSLPITRSPAWIFLGSGGYRIVEGTFDLERFITPLGQYKDPKWIDAPRDGTGEAQKF